MSLSTGGGLIVVGWLSLMIGVVLLYLNQKQHASMDVEFGNFSGPVYFIFLAAGIVLIFLGMVIP
jgi:uncharacterized membrane protein